MSGDISVFRSPEGEALYHEAYKAVLRLWPIHFEELYVPTRLGQTHVIASGPKAASPVLLLHPAGCSSTIWYRNVAALSKQYKTFAVDTMSEVNLSRPSRSIRGGRDFSDWMADLLDGLKLGRAHLVGNSFGAYVALNTALTLPDRVRKVVLISPAATFDPMRPLYRHFSPAYILGYLTGSTRPLLQAYEWTWQGFPRDEAIAQLRVLTALHGAMRHGAPEVFTDDQLRKIQTPILLLIGDHEVVYDDPNAVIERAKRLIPQLKADRVPNANHNAEYTNPQAVNKKILEFFKEAPKAAGRRRPRGATRKRTIPARRHIAGKTGRRR